MKKYNLKRILFVIVLTFAFLSANFMTPGGWGFIAKNKYKNIVYASPKSHGGFKSGGFKSGGFKSGGFKSGLFKSSGKSKSSTFGSSGSSSKGFSSGGFFSSKKKSNSTGSNYSGGTKRSFIPIPIPIPWGHSNYYGGSGSGFSLFGGIFSLIKFIFKVIIIIIIIIIILRIIRRRR